LLLHYHGHAQFLIETATGLRILTDPYDQSVPFPWHPVRADVVTISHEHFDHNCLDKVQGQPSVVRELGEQQPAEGLQVTGYASWHDDRQGAERGPNRIYIMCFDGLRLAHLGDLGAVPQQPVLDALKGVDLLLIPVGGTYTLGPKEAAALCHELSPRIIIPMHFKRGEQGFQNIQPVDDFVAALAPLEASHQPLLRITRRDIGEAPGLVVLTPDSQAG